MGQPVLALPAMALRPQRSTSRIVSRPLVPKQSGRNIAQQYQKQQQRRRQNHKGCCCWKTTTTVAQCCCSRYVPKQRSLGRQGGGTARQVRPHQGRKASMSSDGDCCCCGLLLRLIIDYCSYVWALSKNWFKRQPLSKRKSRGQFKQLVAEARSPAVVRTAKVVRGSERMRPTYHIIRPCLPLPTLPRGQDGSKTRVCRHQADI